MDAPTKLFSLVTYIRVQLMHNYYYDVCTYVHVYDDTYESSAETVAAMQQNAHSVTK